MVAALMAAVIVLLIALMPPVLTQSQDDPIGLTYQAYSGLAHVYQTGGRADELVSMLNSALNLIEEARVKRMQGLEVEAAELDEQANALIQQVLALTPGAQDQASRVATEKTIITLALIPVAVSLSTVAFYLGLRLFRRYERAQLFEMEIVEKEET